MTIHHQSQRALVEAGLAFEWDLLPEACADIKDIPVDAQDIRLLRRGNSLRGVGDLQCARRVWAYNVNQELFEEICSLPEVEILFMEKVNAEDLSRIAKLQKLRCLTVEGNAKIVNLSWVTPLSTLESLALRNLQSIHSIVELSELVQLKALAVDGGVWKPVVVDSLMPISQLKLLRLLSLVNCKVRDRSLTPLVELQSLRHLHCGDFFPKAEFANLEKKLPNLSCDWFTRTA